MTPTTLLSSHGTTNLFLVKQVSVAEAMSLLLEVEQAMQHVCINAELN
jgi:hypothetical protein